MSSPSDSARPLAVITGASSGIGRAVAVKLALRGYRTLLIARRTALLDELAAELSHHAPSVALTLGLHEPDAIEPAMKTLLETHGPVDVLINNAGDSVCSPMLEQPMDLHRRLMQVHYFAAVTMIRAALPSMLERKRGHIINIASIAAKMGPYGHAAYAAAKAALISLTQTLAADYQHSGVNFSYVNPGIVRTEFFSNPGYETLGHQVAKRGIPAERIATGVLKLIDKPKLELCIPRLYRIIDWFKAISPGWAHRIVAKGSRPRGA